MIDSVFISDLHLHPNAKDINARFERFIRWAAKNTRTLYILGDFFHAWVGDDGVDDSSRAIADRLAWLSAQGVALYFMAGNRDFLIGARFAKLAHLTILPDPTVITLGDERVLLSHGDRFCTADRGHQWLMWLTRNKLFSTVFLRLPLTLRNKIANNVRKQSKSQKKRPDVVMDVVAETILTHMKQYGVKKIIHGHTHRAGIFKYTENNNHYLRCVMSDWDDNPSFLCYDKAKGIYLDQIK